ncbi:MAG: hypothetical protein QGG60_04790 [Anaerolineales bacterium]|nr:hypothetical protein [Anaerolineales bacterium]MDP7644002.1 hypothetical protein [Anaerolineales bacterium]HJL69885.1 hypothetical protein [Anaerolineales bacterium]
MTTGMRPELISLALALAARFLGPAAARQTALALPAAAVAVRGET